MGRPGSVLGASRGRLGAALGVLGRLGSVLRALWDVLGASWNFLLILLGNPPQKLSILPPKMDPPDLQESSPHCSESMILQILRFSRFPWIWARFWCQLGSILKGFWLSWGGLGVSWGLLGASWGRLGAPWSVLGRLGGVLAPKVHQK